MQPPLPDKSGNYNTSLLADVIIRQIISIEDENIVDEQGELYEKGRTDIPVCS